MLETSPAAGPAIALSGVNLTLGRGAARVHILKDIDLHIGRGEAIGLVGPSGSGKTTLLMVMAGLERADTGSIEVAGSDLRRLDEDGLARFRGRNVGIVFQSFHLIPTMTALENVAVPLELAGWGQSGSGSGSITIRRNCPAASSSAWRSPARCPPIPPSWWLTSRPAIWTSPPASR
jgi:predicted ABC-type transport system involved in lysophospholipase L1 biosynthesis ATPase subunit